jgi:hypothetical protein
MATALSASLSGAWAQTRLDLRAQSKNVDFSAATSTKPSKIGTTLPASCSVGETFLKTDAQPGQNFYACAAGNVWTPQGGATAPNYAAAFSSATTVKVLGAAHKLNTENLVVDCYDNSTPVNRVEPDSVTIDPSTYDVTVNFAVPQSGLVVLNAAGGGGTNIGPVASVFGRTGAITAQSGDYSFGQIGGTVASNQLPVAGGDLSGSLTNATVTALRNLPIASTAPSGGQALVWNGTSGQWQPQTVATSGGAGMATQLGDFQVTRTSSTTLVIGANCSAATPCNVRIGGVVYSLTASPTISLSSGTGLAYIYMSSGGALTVGHNLTLSCSAGCTAVSGIAAFPVNSIPLFTWSATSNTWNPTGVDQRALLSAKTVSAGTGIITVEFGAQTQVAVDSATVPTYFTSAATLAFPSIASGGCASELTFALPGAITGDSVAGGWPATLPAGFTGMMRVSAANTIGVRLCNFSGTASAPPSDTFRATIVRSF